MVERLLDALDPPPSDFERMTEEEFAAELDCADSLTILDELLVGKGALSVVLPPFGLAFATVPVEAVR